MAAQMLNVKSLNPLTKKIQVYHNDVKRGGVGGWGGALERLRQSIVLLQFTNRKRAEKLFMTLYLNQHAGQNSVRC